MVLLNYIKNSKMSLNSSKHEKMDANPIIPMSRIKTIMKSSPEVTQVSADTLYMVCKATVIIPISQIRYHSHLKKKIFSSIYQGAIYQVIQRRDLQTRGQFKSTWVQELCQFGRERRAIRVFIRFLSNLNPFFQQQKKWLWPKFIFLEIVPLKVLAADALKMIESEEKLLN